MEKIHARFNSGTKRFFENDEDWMDFQQCSDEGIQSGDSVNGDDISAEFPIHKESLLSDYFSFSDIEVRDDLNRINKHSLSEVTS